MGHSGKPRSEILPPGSIFGRYRIERVVGRGGMGAVYEATHVELKKRVAIKVLLPSVAENPEVRARFLREGQSVVKIKHPHVADVYDVGTQQNITYLVMEFLDGEDLGTLLKRDKQVTAQHAADIIIPVLAAIAIAHEENIVHRDLKPANIFLSVGRRKEIIPKVVDFGISKVVNEDVSEGLTSTGAVIGTPFYMSPEQANGDKVLDARTDIYSIGVILYQMLTGKRPFQADSMYQILHKIVLGNFEPPRALCADIPEGVERIILKAMARAANDRFANAHEMGAALLAFANPRMRTQWEPTFGPTQDVPLLEVPVPEDRTPAPAVKLAQTASMPRAAALRDPEVSSPQTLAGQDEAAQSTLAPPHASRVLLGAALAASFGALALVAYFAFFNQGDVKTIQIVEPPPAPSKVVETQPAQPSQPSQPEPYAVRVEVDPAGAKIELDGAVIGSGKLEKTFARNGAEHTLRVSMTGYESTSVVFRDAPPPKQIALKALPEPKKHASKARAKKDEPAEKKGANEALIIR